MDTVRVRKTISQSGALPGDPVFHPTGVRAGVIDSWSKDGCIVRLDVPRPTACGTMTATHVEVTNNMFWTGRWSWSREHRS